MRRFTVFPLYALTVLLSLTAAGPSRSDVRPDSPLDGYYDLWLAGVSRWILPAERETLLALGDDLHRELFLRRFWEVRTSGSDAGALERWRESFLEVRRRFKTVEEDRAQALLVAGKPARVTPLFGCRELIRFLEVWSYDDWHARHASGGAAPSRGFDLVFYRDSNLDRGVYRHWSPSDGTGPLLWGRPVTTRPNREWSVEELVAYATDNGCFERAADVDVIRRALHRALDADALRKLLVTPPADTGWLEDFRAEIAGEVALPAAVEIDFPGRYQGKTVLHGIVRVPVGRVRRNAEDLLLDRLTVSGDVRLGDRLVDVFEVVHHVAGATPEDGWVALDFYRRLRPATYTLNLRAEDADGLGLLRQVLTVAVPGLEREAEPPPGRWSGFAALTREQVGILTTFPSVELLPPDDGLPVGRVEIAAVTTGGPIERVDFLLDGTGAGSDDEPPFAVELDLGETPRERRVTALALDPAGREIARDTIALSPTRARRFAVHLVEPAAGALMRGVPVDGTRVVVEVPDGESLDRLELYLNERLLATLREAPFYHPLDGAAAAARHEGTTYLRAVAHLASGGSAEDVVILYSRDAIDEIDVQWIELYTTVIDPHGHPVTGLGAGDFRILDDGVEQTIERFATVEKLAINVALLMDVSGSMRGRVGMATRSAQRFFETVLRPKDLASLSIFNHDIRRVVPFTADGDRLRYAADGFRAFGTTRLHDSLIYTVHSFGGLDGKRALVLLSDGQDVDSDFKFKQVLELSLRAGVAVYPILLDLEDEATRDNLVKLADETGGSYFSIRTVAELDPVYRRIEQELRSQYLLVYQAPGPAAGRGFRRIGVEVLGSDLKARTLRGYYP